MTITRRDFLNGVALTIGAGVSPLQAFGPALASDRYPPALTGLRGHHPGAFETAHAMALEGNRFDATALPVSERYDLVIVGAGISGLAAAWFHRQKNPSARILILDNHDDFGGHAKRNEFTADGRLILGYGGSESLQSPSQAFGPETLRLIEGLGIDVTRFEKAFQRRFFSGLGLSRGVYFDAERFGASKLVAGDPQRLVADDLTAETMNARDWAAFIGDFPLPADERAALLKMHVAPEDYLAGKSVEDKTKLLKQISYHAYLVDHVKLPERAALYFRNRPNDFSGFCTDGFPAMDAYKYGYPGFAALGLPPPDAEAQAEMNEPYIYHFPDGNASLARLIVRALIPGSAPGRDMEDIVLARFDYGKLDTPANEVRIRLSSTAVDVRNVAGGVEIAYATGGVTSKLHAKNCILACFNAIVPFILKETPPEQATALRRNVKIPLVYTKVLASNWTAFVKAGVHEIYAPARPYSRVKLDYPVDLGGYAFPRDPSRPACLHMVHTPTPFDPTVADGRDLVRMGRGLLLGMSFEDHETAIRSQLQEMLGPHGFDHAKDILAITVNRWSHGYSWSANSLYDDEDEAEQTMLTARRKVGNVAIANSDSGWDPYIPGAVSQAWRAVEEIAG